MIPPKLDFKPVLIAGAIVCSVAGWLIIEGLIWLFSNVTISL